MRIYHSPYMHVLQMQLYTIAQRALQKEQPLLILVPAQATAMVERGILQHCGVAGFVDAEVLSFEKLTERMGELAGGRALPVLDGAGFAMLAKLAMNSRKDALTALDAADPVLHQQAAELVASLKSEGISPAQLRELAASAAPGTAAKLKDVAEIYAEMERLAGADLRDSRDAERAAAAHFSDTPAITGQDILIYGFDTLTALRMDTICALDKAAKSVTILAEAAEDGVLTAQWETLSRLMQTAARHGCRAELLPLMGGARSGALGHLFTYLYQYPYTPWQGAPEGLSMCCLPDRRAEVSHAAARILALACTEGCRMSEIGVLVGDTAGYAPLIQEIFTSAGIPFFLQSKRSLQKSSLWAWLTPLLELLRRSRWRVSDAYAYLKGGFCCTQTEADALIRWCTERGIKGYQLQKGLPEAAPAELEALRAKVFAPVCALQAGLESGEAAPSELLNQHMKTLGIPERLETQAAAAEEAGLSAQSRFLRQVWEATEGLLNSCAVLGALPVGEYADALTAGAASKELSVIPPTTDEVVIGDGVHAIWAGKRVLFALGLNEGVLPAVPDRSGLITGAEVEALRAALPGFPDKLTFDDQKAYLRKNLTLTHALHLSYNTKDGEPSYLADRIRRLFPELEVQECDPAAIPHPKAALPGLARELRIAKEGGAPGEAAAAYFAEQQEVLSELLSEVYAEAAPGAMPPATARALYGAPRASVSRIEEYYRCPYRHFMTYGMRPRETVEFAEDYADIGTYLHSLMEEFTRQVAAQGEGWEALSETRMDALLSEAAATLQQGHNHGIFQEPRYAFMEGRLREEAGYALRAVQAHLKDTSARILAGEAGFGGDILQLPTRYGMLTVRGRIDRIDQAEGENGETYLRVVDYKTGDRSFSLGDVVSGVGLQLVIYLMAAVNRYRALGKRAEGAGGFYFNIDLPYLKEGEPEEKRLGQFRMKGFLLAEEDAARALDSGEKKLLSMNLSMADVQQALGENCFTAEELTQIFAFAKTLLVQATEEIYSGQLRVAPLEQNGRTACTYCDYAAVCMHDGARPGKRVAAMTKQEALAYMRSKSGREDA